MAAKWLKNNQLGYQNAKMEPNMAPIRVTSIIGPPTGGVVLGVWLPPKGSKILIILDLRPK